MPTVKEIKIRIGRGIFHMKKEGAHYVGKTYFYKIVSYKRSGKQTFRSKSSNVVKIKR
jgi:hypothetical protein